MGKKGGEDGEEEGGKVKSHGFVGGRFHGGHLEYGEQECPVGGIVGGNEGWKGEFSFCQLAACGKESGVVEELKAVGAQEHVADLSGPVDAGGMEFVWVYEHDIAFLKGKAAAVDFQAAGDGGENDFQFFVPVYGDMGAGFGNLEIVDVEGDISHGSGAGFLVL